MNFCIDCNVEIRKGSTRCKPCMYKSRRKKKYYEACIVCGVEKKGLEQTSARCQACGNASRPKHGSTFLYPTCVDCGEKKEKRKQRSPRCYPCAYAHRKSKSIKVRTPEVVRMRDLVGTHVRNALKDNKKGQPCFQHLPYSVHELMEHIEKQFSPDMSWENQGSYWHLDHIVPQALLPYDSYDHPNFLKCWDLRNLQPLPASKNCAKGARLTEKGKALMELL